ncbi:MAG TPA: hypothetical protein VHC44_17855, partial [Verrucomicrobiae bacterium]|nr:hypothetical protein [Verrucomicrobiae bacterium]
VLAADQNSAVRNGAEAISLAERAASLTGGEQPFVLDTLAMAYAEAGRFTDAQAAVQKAIQAGAVGAQKTVPEMQERLRLYQSGQPYREDFSKTMAPKSGFSAGAETGAPKARAFPLSNRRLREYSVRG